MIYFEFNRTDGKEKYIQMTEKAFQQAAAEGGRYFVMYEEQDSEGYVLECTEQELKKIHKEKNHSEYAQKNADGRKVIPLSLDTDEIDCYDSVSDIRSVFHNGDTALMDEAVLNRIEKSEKIVLLRKALGQLTPDEQYIIQEVFQNSRTRSSLAKEFGIARETMNQKYHKILRKLRKLMTNK